MHAQKLLFNEASINMLYFLLLTKTFCGIYLLFIKSTESIIQFSVLINIFHHRFDQRRGNLVKILYAKSNIPSPNCLHKYKSEYNMIE